MALLRLTTRGGVASVNNTHARLVLRERRVLSQRAFVELVVWHLPAPVRGSAHRLKYRLAYVANRQCVIRFDNEAGKGDHKHIDDKQQPYAFVNLEQTQDDFWRAVRQRRRGK
jgi:Family of unknown function (DUF6516)